MTNTMQDSFGSLTYDDKVIKKIVTLTLAEMPEFLVLDQKLAKKVMPTTIASNAREIEVKVKNNLVYISADIIVEYGCNIPGLYETATSVVRDELERMTTLTLGEIHLYVRDIFPVADFQNLYYNEVKGSTNYKIRPAEKTFSTRINHFVDNIKERAAVMGGKFEGNAQGGKTKTRLFTKRKEGKTREFITNLSTKTTNFGKTNDIVLEKIVASEPENAMTFAAIDVRKTTELELSDKIVDTKQKDQVSDDVFHKIDPEKPVTEKK